MDQIKQNFFEKVIPIVTKEQDRILSYIIQHPEEYDIIDKKYIQDNKFDVFLYDTVFELIEKKVPINKDILLSKCRQNDVNFKEELLNTYYISKDTIEEIQEYIQIVKDTYNKKQILGDISSVVSSVIGNDNLDYDKLQKLSESLLNSDSSLDETLLDFKELSTRYRDTIEKRKQGLNQRSLGFSVINELLARPGAVGEMTGIVAFKGLGKSILLKCMENSLINQHVCVVSINLEMEAESNYDRLISVRENISLHSLLHPQKNSEDINKRIERGIEKLEKIPNYFYYNESQITLSELDLLLYKAKKEFKKRGCLSEDEYILVTIDLADMIEDFSNAEGAYGIKKACNKLHKITRKHKCHTLYLVQANENKFRAGKTFTTPEACDSYRTQVEDVEGGATYAARSRVILSLNRPLLLKKRFLHERKEEWDLEKDIMYITVVKQNDGKLGECKFIFSEDSFRLLPYKTEEELEKEQTRRRR